VITLSDVALSHGTRTLFRGVSLRVVPGSRIAVVGANGAGKTTLLEVIAGRRRPDAGTVSRRNHVTVGFLRQEIAELAGRPAVEEVMAGSPAAALERRLRVLESRIQAAEDAGDRDELVGEYGRVQTRYEQLGGYGLEAEARRVLAGLGFSDADMDRDVGELSGGWMMRVALAGLLLSRPDVLLLDEPTNHLDLASVTWLEEVLRGYEGAVVLVSHDRDFMNGLVERVVELAAGAATEYAGDYAAFVEQREARLEQLRAAARNQQRKIQQTEEFITRFRSKATLASRVQSRVKALDKLDRVEVPADRAKALTFRFPDPPRAGRVVVELTGVAKSYPRGPGRPPDVVYDGLDLVLERGQKVALVGPNGAGKSTLLRILAGVEPVDRGSRRLGHHVAAAYFAQHAVDALDLDRTVLAELTAEVDTRRVNPRSLLGAFRFPGDEVDKQVGVLSGGERSRLALAKLMAEPVNLLCLDEPTNHLDVTSRDVVEDALVAYPGTIVLITHDRHLLRAVADTIVEVRDGTATLHPGGYDDYLDRARTGPGRHPGETTGGDGRTRRREAARKRADAERRNRVYRETREVRRRLAEVEEALGEAEAEVAHLTRLLGQPGVYDDGADVKRLVARHGAAKDRAADLTREWERLYAANERATASAERGPVT
jgi:ATP-binding cassette subfamily F protein 3